jgi:N-terminal domain of anti-restriction factor ArdC
MDWECDALYNKAKVFAQRAHDEPVDSSLFAFWMSLSLELLARAALSQVHPVLLADPREPDNIHYAFGINPKGVPKSIPAKALFSRCSIFVPGFTDNMSAHCLIVAERRNTELHTAAAAFEGIDNSKWLPATYEVLEVLLTHLKRDFQDFLGEHGDVAVEALKDRRDTIKKDVQEKLAASRKFYRFLSPEEREQVAAKAENSNATWLSPVFRASLVQTSAALRPYRSACSSTSRVGDPPPLALATPRWRGPGPRRVCENSHSRTIQKQKLRSPSMSSKAAKKTAPKLNLYQTVTDRIIASLKAGVIPWEKPWKSPHFTGGPFPRNFRTGRPYRGINIMLLWSSSYSSPFWITFNQAKELNGTVRKGEKGNPREIFRCTAVSRIAMPCRKLPRAPRRLPGREFVAARRPFWVRRLWKFLRSLVPARNANQRE